MMCLRVSVAFIAALACAAGQEEVCPSGGCRAGDDELAMLQAVGTSHQMGVNDGEGEVKSCMTMSTPEESARKAALASKQATDTDHVKTIKDAGATAQTAKDAALTLYNAAVAAANTAKVNAIAAAEVARKAVVSKANADAAVQLALDLNSVELKRSEDTAKAVAATKATMQDINQKHQHVLHVASKNSEYSTSTSMGGSQESLIADQKDSLAQTKSAFQGAISKHTVMLAEADAAYSNGKANAEAAALTKKNTMISDALKAKAKAVSKAEVKEKQESDQALAGKAAALARAEATKQESIAKGDAEAKTEHMMAWVDTMSAEMASTKVCTSMTPK